MKEIGKFCSVAKKGTIIYPKQIPGYTAPEGQVLTEDAQKFNFVYTPIEYTISYDLGGGIAQEAYKAKYTVEDEDYTPSKPVREDYKFAGWTPEKIAKGSIGDQSFVANWTPNAILVKGSKLSSVLSTLAGGKDKIMAILHAVELPEGDYVNISSTSTPILASFSDGVIRIWSSEDIYCNSDMSGAFSGLTILRDISALSEFICKKNTNINSIFKDCPLLSDVSAVESWADGVFSDFADAFTGTAALAANKVPSWYRWEVKINYLSSTGKSLEIVTEKRIPGEVVYPKAINGYKAVTESITITSPTEEYTFVYDPVAYKITYELNGGELLNPKTSYTIEDETYYPPEPVRQGYYFDSWEPACIEQGETGNASFIANYTI